MSGTFESFREALEQEIKKWNGFANALRKDDRESFDALMDMCRSYAPEASCTEKTTVLETMEMSIILAHDNRIRQLEETIATIKPPENVSHKEESHIEPIVIHQKPTLKKAQRSLGDFG
jgi:hypothetical protein